MTKQDKEDLAELYMKLHLLGWVLDSSFSVDTDFVFDAPDSYGGYFGWISFDTEENGAGDAGSKTAGNLLSFATYPIYYKDLIEIIEQEDNWNG